MIDRLLLDVVGSVLLLLYGIRLTGNGFRLAFSAWIDRAWSSARESKARAFLLGAAATAVLQSSGAMVTLLISFGHATTLSLSQSLIVILGADLGATVTVQLLSFRIYEAGLAVLSIGIALYLWGGKPRGEAVGQGVLGFGFVLLALKFLSGSADDVGRIDGLRILMAELSGAPFSAFATGALLAALLQSGTAVMILLIAFTKEGLLGAGAVLPFVFGANAGGATVAFVAASGLAAEGRRIAWGHFGMKAAGALLLLLAISLLPPNYHKPLGDGPHLVAYAHTLFNFFIAVLFFPLTGRIATLLDRSIPGRRAAAPRGKTAFIDRAHLPVAGAALGQAAREIMRMADMIQEMLDDAIEVICRGNADRIVRVGQIDDDIDVLTREIKIFLSALAQTSMDEAQTRRSMAYIGIVTDLENIGDFVDRTMTDHLRPLSARKKSFSEEGGRELEGYLTEVGDLYRSAVSCFITGDPGEAAAVVERRRVIGIRERELRTAHIQRLQEARPDTLETSEAHMDVLAAWKGIAAHCASIARAVVDMGG